MHRIDTINRVIDLFGIGKDGFRNGDKANSISSTEFSAEWCNEIQEGTARVIEAAGIALVKGDYDQLVNALIVKGLMGNYFTAGDAGGDANDITTAVPLPPVALVSGMGFVVRASAANTSPQPTFTPNPGTIAPRYVCKGNNLPLVPGDVAGPGHRLILDFDATLNKWVLANPAKGIIVADGGYMLVRDEKASGTNGGSATAGIQTRTLNTVVANTINGASLSGNVITLPAGTFRVRARAPAGNVALHKALLVNVTSSITYGGTSENCSLSNTGDLLQSHSIVEARFTLGAAANFRLDHYCDAAYANLGLGSPTSSGHAEIYSLVEIIKES